MRSVAWRHSWRLRRRQIVRAKIISHVFVWLVRLQLYKLSADLNVLIQTFRYSPSEDDISSFTDMQEIVTEQDSMFLFIPRQHAKEFLREKSKDFFKYPQFLIRNGRLSTCEQCHKHTGIHARPLEKVSSCGQRASYLWKITGQVELEDGTIHYREWRLGNSTFYEVPNVSRAKVVLCWTIMPN